jgi:membrane protease YdiL (CAAX protease family)
VKTPKLKLKQNNIDIKIPIIIGIIISIPINFLINILLGWDPTIINNHVMFITGLIFQWVIILILFLIIFFWENNSFSSIGIKKIEKKDLIWGFFVFIIQIITLFTSEKLVNYLNLTSQGIETTNILMLPTLTIIFLIITAGITEEIIFRGYLIERLNLLSNSLIMSAIVSYVLFILFHIPFWGIGGAIQISIWAIPITVLYIRRRNLTTCIIIHLIYDSTILIPVLFGS